MIRELYSRGFVFTQHRSPEDFEREYENLSNPFTKFFSDRIETDPDSAIPNADFKEEFSTYLADKSFRIWSDREIKREMKEKGVTSKVMRIEGTDKPLRAWKGIKWKETRERAEEEEDGS